MSLIETEETNQFTFEAFAAHPFYTEINRSLVRQALASLAPRPANATLTIVDMACGTGAVTRLIAQEMQRMRRRARIIGVDPSAEALRRAQKGMEKIGAKAEFIQGEATDLPYIAQSADAAFFCNAIHLLPDKLAAFRLISSILAPDGIFACNSGFYDGTYVEGTERFYRLWTSRAVRWLRKEHPEIGLISVDAWRDIGHYWLFIEGALPGVPLSLGAAALEVAVYQAGQELGITETPRNWLQLIACKK